MLNNEKQNRRKKEKGRGLLIYLLFTLMLLVSLKIYFKKQNENIEAGAFGTYKEQNNITFKDGAEKLLGGCFMDIGGGFVDKM